MPLQSIDWIKEGLAAKRQIHSGNDISFVTQKAKYAFRYYVSALKRAEFSWDHKPDIGLTDYVVEGYFFLPQHTVDTSVGGIVLMQWHGYAQDAKNQGVQPLVFKMQNNKLIIQHRNPGELGVHIWTGDPVYNKWIKIRFEYMWRVYIRAYIDDSLVATVGNHAVGDLEPYHKYGVYRIGGQGLIDAYGDPPAFPPITMYWSGVLKTRVGG